MFFLTNKTIKVLLSKIYLNMQRKNSRIERYAEKCGFYICVNQYSEKFGLFCAGKNTLLRTFDLMDSGDIENSLIKSYKHIKKHIDGLYKIKYYAKCYK